VLLGVVFFVGVLIGSRGTKDTSNTDPGNRDLAPGDAADVGGVRVTLLEAFGTDADTSDRELYLPSDEYTFVVTRFRVHNTSGKEFKLAGEGWLKPRSDAGTTLDPVALLRQGQPTTPREDRYIGDTPIVEAGADVTGTLAFVARRDEAVSVEFYNDFVQRKPDAAWNLGPVSKLPERPFLATR
jgi:hypothetical protein